MPGSVIVRDGAKPLLRDDRSSNTVMEAGFEFVGIWGLRGRLKVVGKLVLGWGVRETVIDEIFSTQLCF